MEKTISSLNQLTAETIVLYQKLRHFHWHVDGSDFLVLHSKFEEIYNDVNEITDQLAERVVSLGGSTISSLDMALKQAKLIKEHPAKPDYKQMVSFLVKDLEALIGQMNKVAATIDESKDRHTINLLDDAIDQLEAHTWMLKAYLK